MSNNYQVRSLSIRNLSYPRTFVAGKAVQNIPFAPALFFFNSLFHDCTNMKQKREVLQMVILLAIDTPQLLDEAFVISKIIKVAVGAIKSPLSVYRKNQCLVLVN